MSAMLPGGLESGPSGDLSMPAPPRRETREKELRDLRDAHNMIGALPTIPTIVSLIFIHINIMSVRFYVTHCPTLLRQYRSSLSAARR